MRANDTAVVQGSDFPDWITPYDLRAALMDEFRFDVDLAANAANSIVESWLGPGSNLGHDDALTTAWHDVYDEPDDRHLVGFLNPPFSREMRMPLDPWVKKCWLEAQAGFATVALLPHRPDTRWWRLTQHAAEIREIPHRVPFLLPVEVFEARNALRLAQEKKPIKGKIVQDGVTKAVRTNGAGFPSAVVIWRPQPGVIAPALPRRVLWDYLNRTKRAA